MSQHWWNPMAKVRAMSQEERGETGVDTVTAPQSMNPGNA